LNQTKHPSLFSCRTLTHTHTPPPTRNLPLLPPPPPPPILTVLSISDSPPRRLP
jgi:hypothetical protein